MGRWSEGSRFCLESPAKEKFSSFKADDEYRRLVAYFVFSCRRSWVRLASTFRWIRHVESPFRGSALPAKSNSAQHWWNPPYCLIESWWLEIGQRYTANVYWDLQGVYREIRVQGFQIYGDCPLPKIPVILKSPHSHFHCNICGEFDFTGILWGYPTLVVGKSCINYGETM